MTSKTTLTPSQVQEITEALQTVKDPEIDSINVLELGMVERIYGQGHSVTINMLPTFMGCPALDLIKSTVMKAVTKISWIKEAQVEFIYDPPWTSDRVTDEGRDRLKEFGIAPPPRKSDMGEWNISCPYCNSTYTTMENLFGPTACRSILYCKKCKNPFEAMKPISTMM